MLIVILQVIFAISAAWLLAVFIGYPLLMFILSRFKPLTLKTSPDNAPTIHIITAAYNERDNIRRKIRSHSAFDYPREKVSWTIGSDGSNDGTDTIVESAAESDPRIELVRYDRVGKTRIIYEIAATSTAEILLFTDADIELEPDALRVIADCFSDPTVGGVVARTIFHDESRGSANRGEGLYARMENALRRWESRAWTTLGPTGQCFAVRRGGYDTLTDYRLSDDMHLAISIPLKGLRVWYEPRLVAHERNRRTLAIEFGRRKRVGQQNAATFMEYAATRLPWRSRVGFQLWFHRILRNLSPIPMALLLLTSIALSTTSTVYAVTAVLGLCWVVLIVAGYLIDRAGRATGALGHPLYFTAMLTALTIGAFRAWRSGGLAQWESPRPDA